MQGDVLVQLIGGAGGGGGGGGGGLGGEDVGGGELSWVGREEEKKSVKKGAAKGGRAGGTHASLLSRWRSGWGKAWAKKPGGALHPAAGAAADCPPCPPPFFILAISILEVSLYLWVGASDASVEGVALSGFPPPPPSLPPPPPPSPVPTSHHSQLRRLLLYDPHRRWEAWRFATYMLLHTGALHLALNVAIQAMLATPLEAEQGHLRTGLVYLGGGLGGSLSTSMLEPEIYIVGASGGVYALLISQLANVILNFRRLRYKAYRAIAVAVISLADIAFSVYHFVRRGNECPRIGWAAHTGGAVAGFLLGMVLFRSDDEEWEGVRQGVDDGEVGGRRRARRIFTVQTAVRWVSTLLLSAFLTAAVVTNALHPETTDPITHFSPHHTHD